MPNDAKKPTRKERLNARRQATRDALKRAAIECFARSGFADTTIEEISSEAGVSHATFYKHYESKEAISAELEKDIHDDLLAIILPVLQDPKHDSLEKIVGRIAPVVLEAAEREPKRLKAVWSGPRPRVDFVPGGDAVSPELRASIAVRLVDLASNRTFNPEEVPVCVAAVVGIWVNVIFNYLARTELAPSVEVRTRTAELLARLSLLVLGEIAPLRETRS